MKFNYLYEIKNNVNGKIYVGVHSTTNLSDGYMGSGKVISSAIKKYGVENFTKTILKFFDTSEEMFSEEKKIVNEEFLKRSNVYNIKLGGEGGWDFVNKNNLGFPKEFKNREDFNRSVSPFVKGHKYGELGAKKRNEMYPTLSSESATRRNLSGEFGFDGRNHSDATKSLMSGPREKSSGEKNSQYDTMWITDGVINKKVNKFAIIPYGWRKGRILRTVG
jgi:hypothetical protein